MVCRFAETKNQWARDDPAFVVIMVGILSGACGIEAEAGQRHSGRNKSKTEGEGGERHQGKALGSTEERVSIMGKRIIQSAESAFSRGLLW